MLGVVNDNFRDLAVCWLYLCNYNSRLVFLSEVRSLSILKDKVELVTTLSMFHCDDLVIE